MNKTIESPWCQSLLAGLLGCLAHIDDCAAILAILVLCIQISISLHKRKTAIYNEGIAKQRLTRMHNERKDDI